MQLRRTARLRVGVWACTGAVVFCAASVCRADVHLVVGTPEQGGQYATVQAAVDAVPADNTQRYVIDIKPGTYMARVKVPSNKPLITLRGEDPLTTKLTFNEPFDATPNESTNHATVVVQANDFIAENLTLENTYGVGKQALALYAKGDRSIYSNCRFLGFQDTLRSELGRHYFYNSYIEGTVDFIYGKGTAYFENATIFAKSSGYLTAQARENAADSDGYVFKNATILGSAANNTFYLGRPWKDYSRVVFIDSKMGPMIKPAGWSTWSGVNHLTTYYAEFNSMDLNGVPLDVSQRVSWSHQLTAGDLAPYSKENWLAGADGWNPVIETVAMGLPGDFNDDGMVDALDYSVWRNHLGEADEANLNFNGDGNDVGEGDFDVWKLHYGDVNPPGGGGFATATFSASVPEPSWGAMASFAWVFLGVSRRFARIRQR